MGRPPGASPVSYSSCPQTGTACVPALLGPLKVTLGRARSLLSWVALWLWGCTDWGVNSSFASCTVAQKEATSLLTLCTPFVKWGRRYLQPTQLVANWPDLLLTQGGGKPRDSFRLGCTQGSPCSFSGSDVCFPPGHRAVAQRRHFSSALTGSETGPAK